MQLNVAMGSENYTAALIQQEVVKNHLQVTALIQDIQQCTGPLALLNELNAQGREKIAMLKSSINNLASLAEAEINEKKKAELISKVDFYKEQLSTSFHAFCQANVISACVIHKLAREDLLATSEEHQKLTWRKREREDLTKTSNRATEKLLSISRHLAETTKHSADTLDTLLSSSDKISGTKDELEHQQQIIVQSRKLLGKYSRREVTDKALLALAFVFFLACVFYILQKRLL